MAVWMLLQCCGFELQLRLQCCLARFVTDFYVLLFTLPQGQEQILTHQTSYFPRSLHFSLRKDLISHFEEKMEANRCGFP